MNGFALALRTRDMLARIVLRRLTFVSVAVWLAALFAALQLLGWRDDTAIISGTFASASLNAATIRGVLYSLTYFLAITVSPILLLSAGIDALLRLLAGDRIRPVCGR